MDKWYCFGIVNLMIARATEQQLEDLDAIETWEDQRILEALLAGQMRAISAVGKALPQISEAANLLAERLRTGGRLIYAGAGSSIRIAVLDGSELPATFDMAEEKLGYLIAGGSRAMFDTLAEAEDDVSAGDADGATCTAQDTVVAVAASGSTPYTVAAARAARARGAKVIAIVNNRNTPLAAQADIAIVLETGPEVIAGSTRMGAGTSQKATLNLLSTLTHIKLGAVHDGMMVNVRAENDKLKERAARIVMQIAGVDETSAKAALGMAQGEVKPAVLLCKGARDLAAARKLLQEQGSNLRLAMARLAAP